MRHSVLALTAVAVLLAPLGCSTTRLPAPATSEPEPLGAHLKRAEAIRIARKAYTDAGDTIEADTAIDASYQRIAAYKAAPEHGEWRVTFIPRRLREQNFRVGPGSVIVNDRTGKTQLQGGGR